MLFFIIFLNFKFLVFCSVVDTVYSFRIKNEREREREKKEINIVIQNTAEF